MCQTLVCQACETLRDLLGWARECVRPVRLCVTYWAGDWELCCDVLGCGVEAELCDVVRLRTRLPRVCAGPPPSVCWSGAVW